jgi:hypothetical protein
LRIPGRAIGAPNLHCRRYDAMTRRVSGWQNERRSAIVNVTPVGLLAEMHRRKAEPGSGEKS